MEELQSTRESDSDDNRLSYEYFKGTWSTWDTLFSQAAEFATELGPERLVSISHSADQSIGVVTVWYWEKPVKAHDD